MPSHLSQRIPNEACQLLRAGRYSPLEGQIIVGSYTFPFDLDHISEIFDLMGSREEDSLEKRIEGFHVMLEFVDHAARRLIEIVKAAPEVERERYRQAIVDLTKQMANLAAGLMSEE